MRKVLISVSAAGVFMMSVFLLEAQTGEQDRQFRGQLKDSLELRHNMRQIERQVVEEDSEIQRLIESAKLIQKQIRERIEQKLADNPEYQSMKEEWDAKKEEWQKRHPGGLNPEMQERMRNRIMQERKDRKDN